MSGDTTISMLCYEGKQAEVQAELLLTFRVVRGRQARYEAGDVPDVDTDGRTPLHWAATGGHDGLVEFLLRRPGLDVNRADGGGWTALACAASAGRLTVVAALLAAGADANVRNKQRQVPLHFHKGREDIAEALLAGTADVDAQDHLGMTPLMRACTLGRVAVCRVLLGGGAEPSVVDASGNTCLHYACEGHHADAAALLVENGASVHARNAAGKSPTDLAPPHVIAAIVALRRK